MDRQLTQRGEERRRQLMAYATSRFAENGFHPTSVAEITEGMGVGKGVFYWYFDSKEALLRAILADAQLDLRRRQRAALADAATPSERIERGIRASMRWSIDHADYFRLFQFAATDERFSDGLRKGESVAVKDAATQLRAAMDAGEIAPGDPVLLSHALLGVHTHLVHLVHRGVLEPTDEVIDTAVSFCLHGLLGRR
ncbi:MAG: TetR/AcrR family transcriptional regulator [Acidimicrobiales bacterium]|nr:TetR/AcrR family transcriptional regulator [Acidimicrobiales bacterium]HRW39307.1 TetR/AcrR family transcriptional regulator [Aquihabitans sp.]